MTDNRSSAGSAELRMEISELKDSLSTAKTYAIYLEGEVKRLGGSAQQVAKPVACPWCGFEDGRHHPWCRSPVQPALPHNTVLQPPAAPVETPPEVIERRRKGLSDYEKPPLGQPPADPVETESEVELVCAEAYQVVGSMLSDLGQFDTPRGQKILDNLSQAKMVHRDVLPWPSFEVPPPRLSAGNEGAVVDIIAAGLERTYRCGMGMTVNKAKVLQLHLIENGYEVRPLSEPQEAWRPMETIPTDGLIDIWTVGYGAEPHRVSDCYYDSICDEWRTSRPAGQLMCIKRRYITHWMPRPGAPLSRPDRK